MFRILRIAEKEVESQSRGSFTMYLILSLLVQQIVTGGLMIGTITNSQKEIPQFCFSPSELEK